MAPSRLTLLTEVVRKVEFFSRFSGLSSLVNVLRLSFPFLHLISGYADDLNIASSHKIPEVTTHNLQLMCNAISLCCSQSKMSFDALKTVLLLSKNSAQLLPILAVDSTTETVFLGFTLDLRPKWSSHFNANSVAAGKVFLYVKLPVHLLGLGQETY